MIWKWAMPLFLFICSNAVIAAQNKVEKKVGLKEVRALIQQNRSVIIEALNEQIASENLHNEKSDRLPDLLIGGDGYLSNKVPLTDGTSSSNSLLYHFNISSEFDLYTGGKHRHAISRMGKEKELSEERLKSIEQEVELKAYILLYDIYRNIKYMDFIRSSIHLREKEYERIDQLFKNGVVLKSDLLRSKLYITDLQKDEIEIKNSIEILSDKLCLLLGVQERFSITPCLESDLSYAISESSDDLFNYALTHSPQLSIQHLMQQREEIVLKEIGAEKLPHLKLYAKYGIGSPQPYFTYKHQLGGEIGLKLGFSISSFYKTHHQQKAQQHRITRQKLVLTDEEENLRDRINELYIRYNESLINIKRAIDKIAMSEESTRILRNSYYNQQSLLIDVLESETKAMEASFEWVEAVVNSQKYYWALKQISGYLQ